LSGAAIMVLVISTILVFIFLMIGVVTAAKYDEFVDVDNLINLSLSFTYEMLRFLPVLLQFFVTVNVLI